MEPIAEYPRKYQHSSTSAASCAEHSDDSGSTLDPIWVYGEGDLFYPVSSDCNESIVEATLQRGDKVASVGECSTSDTSLIQRVISHKNSSKRDVYRETSELPLLPRSNKNKVLEALRRATQQLLGKVKATNRDNIEKAIRASTEENATRASLDTESALAATRVNNDTKLTSK